MSSRELDAAIGEIALRLPPGQVASLAEALEECAAPAADVRGRVVRAVASPAFADRDARLVCAWQADDGLNGAALAVAVRAASGAVGAERAEESIEAVWTGPRIAAVPVRLTREVLIDVIRGSRESLFIVSFAAYKVEVILTELASAAERWVAFRLILESVEVTGGTLTSDAARAFDDLREGVSLYVWPTEKRPTLARGRAPLHAKAAIADSDTASVTNANLAGYAISENMELHLLVRDGPIPCRLAEHLRELIASGTLVEVSR
jgi:cardiolipin synthase A/B